MYNKGNVVTVMFLNGMELIGTLVSEGEDVVVIDKPMLCQATKNGVSFTPAISLTGDVVEGEFHLLNLSSKGAHSYRYGLNVCVCSHWKFIIFVFVVRAYRFEKH